MRRHAVTAGILLGAVLGSSVAFGGFTFRPIQRFFANAVGLKFGGTEAAPAAELVASTDIDQNFLAVDDEGGNQLVIGNLAAYNASGAGDFDHAASTNPRLYIHSDTNPDTANDEYLELYTTQASAGTSRAYLNSPKVVSIKGANGTTTGAAGFYYGETSPPFNSIVAINASSRAYVDFQKSSATTNRLLGDFGGDQFQFITHDASGNQIVIANSNSTADDAQHCSSSDCTNPSLFIHSDTDVGTNPGQYIGFYHDQTDSVIESGTGDIKLSPATGAFVQKTSFWISKDFAHDSVSSGETVTVAALQAGDIVIAAAIEVTEAWDGSGVDIDFGPASDTDGIYDGLDQTSDDLGQTGYKCEDWDKGGFSGTECAFKEGGVLASSGGKIKRYFASGSENLLLTYTNEGTSVTQGEATVWAEVVRLK